MQLLGFLVLAVSCAMLGALVQAYPHDALAEAALYAPVDETQFVLAEPPQEESSLTRVRRQLQLQGGGGGSPGKGFDLSLNGRAPVWTSGNGRHSIDATGGYAQHLGGPYGNSRPNWSAGGVYTFRF